MMTGTINGNGQGMHLYLSSPWQWYQYPYPEVSPHPPWQGHHNCSGYRLAAEWHFIQRNLQHRPIFLDSLSRHHLIKPRVSFNICPFVLSTSGHFIMPWVQLPFKGPEKSIIFCSRLGIIQCTDEDKLQEFQKPGYHFCVIKIFIFVRSKSSYLWDQNFHFCEIKIFIFVKSRSGALTEPSDITSKVIFHEFGNILTFLDQNNSILTVQCTMGLSVASRISKITRS